MASPTVTSEAASVMMNSANSSPAPRAPPRKLAIATSAMLTAFSMSSRHITTTITLRRTSTPKAPMQKSRTASVSHQ